MKNCHSILFSALLSLFSGNAVNAEDHQTFNLFNPMPHDQLRDLSPDRPDATESPITVDAGHLVIEASYFDWRREDGFETQTFMATNLKLGLTENTDLQFVFDAYSREGNNDTDFDNLQIRLKRNLFGNDEGSCALALFPYIQLPANSGEWEGGLMLPFATDLCEGIGLGLMSQFDVVYNDTTLRHEFSWLHTAVVGIDLTDRLGTFIEYIGIASETPYEAYGSSGFTFAINDDMLLDCGVQIGLNRNAEEIGVFGGFTRRF